MCDAARRLRRSTSALLVGLFLSLLTLSPGVALAQSAADYRARLDTLLSLWHEAVEAESETQPPLDTIALRGLELITSPHNREIVQEAARLAMSELRDQLEGDTALLTRLAVFVQFAGDPAPPRHLGERQIRLPAEIRADRERLANRLIERVGAILAVQLDDVLDAWLGGRIPLGAPSPVEKRALYVDLATADSRATRQCLQGHIRACRDALAVDELADPVSVWYAPEQRRRLVARRARWRDEARAFARACTEDDSDEACLELLRSFPVNSFWPLPIPSHRLLLRIALDRGGPNAYTRLFESEKSTIAERLSEVAGIETDSLVSLWRSAVMSARSESRPVSTTSTLGSLAWIVVFFTVALRSTRWRLD